MIFSKHNGYGAGGLRTCHKGGGSSKSAEKMERQRQERIQAAVNTINNILFIIASSFSHKKQLTIGSQAQRTPIYIYMNKIVF